MIKFNDMVNNLKVVYCNDFDDNYHRTDLDPSTELEKEARRIRRRYNNFGEYKYALSVYDEYMSILANKYNGKKMLQIAMKSENFPDFVPHKPRMKNTKTNKLILKKGINLSNGKGVIINDDLIDEIADEFGVSSDYELRIRNSDEVKDKDLDEFMKENKGVVGFKRKNKVTIDNLRSLNNVDFLEAFFKEKNAQKEEEKERNKLSLTDIYEGNYTDDTFEDPDDMVFYNGQYIRRREVDELKIYNTFNKAGWNSLAMMRSKGIQGSKTVTRIVKENIKREKKKKKKKKEATDDFMMSICSNNDFSSFQDFEEAMLNFNVNSVFK